MSITHSVDLNGFVLDGVLWFVDGIGWSKYSKTVLYAKMAAYLTAEDRDNNKPTLHEATVSITIDFDDPESAGLALFNQLRTEIYRQCEADFAEMLRVGVRIPTQVLPPEVAAPEQ